MESLCSIKPAKYQSGVCDCVCVCVCVCACDFSAIIWRCLFSFLSSTGIHLNHNRNSFEQRWRKGRRTLYIPLNKNSFYSIWSCYSAEFTHTHTHTHTEDLWVQKLLAFRSASAAASLKTLWAFQHRNDDDDVVNTAHRNRNREKNKTRNPAAGFSQLKTTTVLSSCQISESVGELLLTGGLEVQIRGENFKTLFSRYKWHKSNLQPKLCALHF